MPINASYEYFNAEKVYLAAVTLDEKIAALEEMIKTAPKHKSSENFVAELKTRMKKLLEKKEKTKKVGKSSKKGIRKEGYQCVILGLTNSGKSSILSKLTNAQPKISQNQFTTKEPEVGAMYHHGIKVQLIENPSIGSENFDVGMIHTADCLLIVIERLSDLERINPLLGRVSGKKVIAINKADLMTDEQIRKLEETIKSKKINGIIISALTDYNLEALKNKITENTGMIRVYTKEPGKERAPNPIMLKPDSTVKEVAESILKGFSLKVRESRVTGPSSKFPNQKVGLNHKLKDQDIVEFYTK